MLAVAGGGQNTECVRMLIKNKADLTLKDPVGNSVFHIAALNHNIPSLLELLKGFGDNQDLLSLELYARNDKGDTPYSIALGLNKPDLIKVFD